ncbi:MAG: iron-sulfur cluster assembly accessory protein [Elusimicrobiota bacterium]
MLTLTQNAQAKIKEFLTSEPTAKGKSLRIGVKPSGCAGYEYFFAFDDKKEGDTDLTCEGFSVLLDAASAGYLKGSTIDFAEDVSGSGFKIANPNVKSSCGCGKSQAF